MPDNLEVIDPDPAVPVSKIKKSKDATADMLATADNTNMSADNNLDKDAFWVGFSEKCAYFGVSPDALRKFTLARS